MQKIPRLDCLYFYPLPFEETGIIPSLFYKVLSFCVEFWEGWQTSRGHKMQISVDKMGEFSWKLLFLGEFLWTFFGEFLWTFWVNFRGHFL